MRRISLATSRSSAVWPCQAGRWGGGRGRGGRVSGLLEVVNHVRCCLDGTLGRFGRRVKLALSPMAGHPARRQDRQHTRTRPDCPGNQEQAAVKQQRLSELDLRLCTGLEAAHHASIRTALRGQTLGPWSPLSGRHLGIGAGLGLVATRTKR